MDENQEKKKSAADAELEREIRKGRKFTLEDAIGRLIGPGGMKGQSPITRVQQAEFQLRAFLRTHLDDSGGVTEGIILRNVMGSELLLHNPEQPLIVLASYLQKLLSSDYLLKDFVRELDVEWGKVMEERPYFEKEGSPPHPDDPYTTDRSRRLLSELLAQLEVESPQGT